MKKISILIAAVFLAALSPASAESEAAVSPVQEPVAWSQECVDLFATTPIQADGRVKPLSTFAAFKLLKFNGRRKCVTSEGRELTPTEWLLDCLYYPEAANTYPAFLVNSSEVLDAIGVSHEGRDKRSRYSYAELSPGLERLFTLAQQYSGIAAQNRGPVQSQIVNLAHNINEYESLVHSLDFARQEYPVDATEGLKRLFPDEEDASFVGILRQAKLISAAISALEDPSSNLAADAREREKAALANLLHQLDMAASRARDLAVFPPTRDLENQQEWLAPGDLVSLAFFSEAPIDDQLDLLAEFEALAKLVDSREAFRTELEQFHEQVVQLAKARGEYATIPLEVTYYRAKFFYYGLMAYVVCFLIVAVMWLRPRSTALHWLAGISLLAPTALLITGIVFRCIIRGRPPVTTLYETILFSTAVAVIIALAIELMNRQKIAVSLAAILGMIGLFVANKYEVREGVDTMPSMVAVLDTNFWLATHVTTVVMGYGAGLLAAAIAHFYIFGRLFGFRKNDVEFYRSVTRMTYGVLCFSLLFSLIGTVLGGIWANESWGRFWGWDPKENGALMIVLWQLVVLHARLGGYIRDLGLNVASVLLAIVIAFSWWGVNLLGVGLHSYGFTSGIFRILVAFCLVESIVAVLGAAVSLRGKASQSG